MTPITDTQFILFNFNICREILISKISGNSIRSSQDTTDIK